MLDAQQAKDKSMLADGYFKKRIEILSSVIEIQTSFGSREAIFKKEWQEQKEPSQRVKDYLIELGYEIIEDHETHIHFKW